MLQLTQGNFSENDDFPIGKSSDEKLHKFVFQWIWVTAISPDWLSVVPLPLLLRHG